MHPWFELFLALQTLPHPLWPLLVWICLFFFPGFSPGPSANPKCWIPYSILLRAAGADHSADCGSLLSRSFSRLWVPSEQSPFDPAVHVPLKPALTDRVSYCVFHLSEWHRRLPNFPDYHSQLFLSVSLTPNTSPSLESAHLNISWICSHLFFPTANLPNSGSHHPSPRRLCQSLMRRILPAPSSTQWAGRILLKMQISSPVSAHLP